MHVRSDTLGKNKHITILCVTFIVVAYWYVRAISHVLTRLRNISVGLNPNSESWAKFSIRESAGVSLIF